MATIEARKNDNGITTYRAKVRLRGYPPESATFTRKTDAREWATRIEADMKAGRYFGTAKRHTFAELADAYERDAASRLKSFADRKRHLRRWRAEFARDLLSDVTPKRIMDVREKLLAEAVGAARRRAARHADNDLRAGPTVNRYLATLSACLSFGMRSLGWLDNNPCQRVARSKEHPGRTRFLTDAELARLLDACRPHPDLYLGVVLSIITGARQSEILKLRWSQIDFARSTITLRVGETKNDHPRTLALAGDAKVLLLERAQRRDPGEERVFMPSKGKAKAKVRSLRYPWENALKEAAIEDFCWHDQRHTAASYMVMTGVSLTEVATILGHKTLSMVLRYAHLASEHVVGIGERLAARLGLDGKLALVRAAANGAR